MTEARRPRPGICARGAAAIGLALLLGASCAERARPDPLDPARFRAPPGAELAFGLEVGDVQNYFHRQGAAAVHLLTRSGSHPRIIAAFPAENQGIGVWFSDAPEGTRLWAGSADGSAL